MAGGESQTQTIMKIINETLQKLLASVLPDDPSQITGFFMTTHTRTISCTVKTKICLLTFLVSFAATEIGVSFSMERPRY